MTKKRRIVAAAVCIVLLAAMLFSAAYIILEADHHCTGDGCPICHEIQICQQVLHTMGTATAVPCASGVSALAFAALAAVHVYAAPAITLISLKVKLSD